MYTVLECFIDVNGEARSQQVLRSFKHLWVAKLYKWWHTFSWEPAAYMNWDVRIKRDREKAEILDR